MFGFDPDPDSDFDEMGPELYFPRSRFWNHVLRLNWRRRTQGFKKPRIQESGIRLAGFKL